MGKPMEKLKVIDPNAPDANRKHGSFKNPIRLTALEQNLQSIKEKKRKKKVKRSGSAMSDGSYSGYSDSCSECSNRSKKRRYRQHGYTNSNGSHMSSHDSMLDSSDDELTDEQLGIPIGEHGVPVFCPFATLQTGQYLGMKVVFDPGYAMVSMYATKKTHLLVLDQEGVDRIIKF